MFDKAHSCQRYTMECLLCGSGEDTVAIPADDTDADDGEDDGGGSGSGMSWQCQTCTYDNDAAAPACEMCAAPKATTGGPTGAAAGAGAGAGAGTAQGGGSATGDASGARSHGGAAVQPVDMSGESAFVQDVTAAAMAAASDAMRAAAESAMAGYEALGLAEVDEPSDSDSDGGEPRRQQLGPLQDWTPSKSSTHVAREPWSCPACTFENIAALTACAMCGTAHPPTTAASGAGAGGGGGGGGAAAAAGAAAGAGAGAGGSVVVAQWWWWLWWWW